MLVATFALLLAVLWLPLIAMDALWAGRRADKARRAAEVQTERALEEWVELKKWTTTMVHRSNGPQFAPTPTATPW
jgi:hypothetical protein